MKVPFSYRSQLFTPILVISALGHVVVLVGAGVVLTPQFAVERAPSSLEVVIAASPSDSEALPPQPDAVLTAEDLAEEVVTVAHPDVAPRPQVTVPQEAPSPPLAGAIMEARPAYASNPAPVYPRLAEERGWQGRVVVKAFVQRDGVPTEVRVQQSSGHQILDGEALRAVRAWRFVPARVGPLSVPSWAEIPIRFVLVDGEKE